VTNSFQACCSVLIRPCLCPVIVFWSGLDLLFKSILTPFSFHFLFFPYFLSFLISWGYFGKVTTSISSRNNFKTKVCQISHCAHMLPPLALSLSKPKTVFSCFSFSFPSLFLGAILEK